MIEEQELATQISDLLIKAKIPHKHLKIARCSGGKNNRTYRVETEAGVFAAKKYFSHPGDLRNRLKAEFAFLAFAEKTAKGLTPKPFAQNPDQSIALYEFIEGKQISSDEITERQVDEAIHFFYKLNAKPAHKQAAGLGNASEACFSIADHFKLIQNRIQKLQGITPDTEETVAARHGVEKLQHHWSNLVERIRELDTITPLETEQRCISPSDFGFHNALKKIDGSICFLDFEYSGWDDPAKMAADFFAQLAVPVPGRFFESFVQKTMAVFPGSDELIRRAKILRPAYVVKWGCIALNAFLPHYLDQRRFVEDQLDVTALQRDQLSKFKRLIQLLENGYDL